MMARAPFRAAVILLLHISVILVRLSVLNAWYSVGPFQGRRQHDRRNAWQRTLVGTCTTSALSLHGSNIDKDSSAASDGVFSRSLYYLPRTVHFRSLDATANQTSFWPVQLYKGTSVDPVRGSNNLGGEALDGNSTSWVNDLVQSYQESLRHDSTTNNKTLPSFSINTSHFSLSKTSRYLLDPIRYDTLSQWQRQRLFQKIAREQVTSTTNLSKHRHLHILYCDAHICVVNKPSGILSVPGPRRNPSLADLVYEHCFGSSTKESDKTIQDCIDQMIVHRLDMDTSGIMVFALTKQALQQLHQDFRDNNQVAGQGRDKSRRRVKKVYQALLLGRLWDSTNNGTLFGPGEFEIDLALERDPLHPPFMRVTKSVQQSNDDGEDNVSLSTPSSTSMAHPSFQKFLRQAPKPSLTRLQILSNTEQLSSSDRGLGVNVTRVALYPQTGRTHQLRVVTAALGHAIVGDSIYGPQGEGNAMSAYGSLNDMSTTRLEAIAQLDMPLCLHAQRLSFYHPYTGAPMMFECDPSF